MLYHSHYHKIYLLFNKQLFYIWFKTFLIDLLLIFEKYNKIILYLPSSKHIHCIVTLTLKPSSVQFYTKIRIDDKNIKHFNFLPWEG